MFIYYVAALCRSNKYFNTYHIINDINWVSHNTQLQIYVGKQHNRRNINENMKSGNKIH